MIVNNNGVPLPPHLGGQQNVATIANDGSFMAMPKEVSVVAKIYMVLIQEKP